MPAPKVDILESDRFFTNTDYTVKFQVKQADGVTAEPITGFALSWVLKRRVLDPDASAIITKTTGAGGIVITDGPNGLCSVVITDTDTAGVSAGAYAHELKRTDSGLETVLCAGLAVLRASAHRTP